MSKLDQGQRAGMEGDFGSRRAQRCSEQGSPSVSPVGAKKTSRLHEAVVRGKLIVRGEGIEAGIFGRTAPLPPPPDRPAMIDMSASDASLLRALGELRDVVGLPEGQVGLHYSVAEVRHFDTDDDREGRREIIAALRADLWVRDAPYPCWSRVVPLADPDPRWPEPWLGAARQVGAALCSAAGPSAVSVDRDLVLAPFAAADLLRLLSAFWLAAGRSGRKVASSAVEIEDPGFFHRGEKRDAAGQPISPRAVVEKGRLCFVPGPQSAGFLLRSSWRDRPAPGWRSLRLRASSVPTSVRGVPLITRISALGGLLFGHGYEGDPERPTRIGPVLLGDPSALLPRVTGAVGAVVTDGTGLPVSTPGLLLGRAPERER